MYLPKKRHLVSLLLLGAIVATPAMAIGFLDDMIYSVKCAAADNVDACKAQAKQDFEDYNRQRQGSAAISSTSSSGGDSGWQKPIEQCFTVSASGSGNIDYAYANIIDKFGFMTLEEKAAWLKQRAGRMKDEGFKHRVVPGYLYDMRDTVKYSPVNGRVFSLFAGAKLKKTKAGGTSLEADYCLYGAEIPYSDAISESFRDAVR